MNPGLKLSLWKRAPRAEAALYGSIVRDARQPVWYAARGAEDSVDGRFAMLATLTALTIVRLEAAGADGRAASVGVTERFVDDMDASVRELGVSDPGIGKQVGAMVGALAGRVAAWRRAVAGEEEWASVTHRSALREKEVAAAKAEQMATALADYWAKLRSANDAAVIAGTA